MVDIGGYNNWSIRRLIKESELVAKRNPWLAHKWMNEAKNQLSIDLPFLFDEYDKMVAKINTYWRDVQNFRWYNEESFWADDKEIKKPKYLTSISDEIIFLD